jgi:hypothetical protein
MLKRLWLVLAGLVLLALGVVFVIVGLDRADKIASIVGAVSGLAGLVVALIGAPSVMRTVHASRTGAIRNRRGSAVTGVQGPATSTADRVVAHRTGEIEDGDGDATTGVRLG